MIEPPHFVQAAAAKGCKSPGMNTFAPQCGHPTIFNGCGLSVAVGLALRDL